jgi:phosphoribosylamine-glycine ligase
MKACTEHRLDSVSLKIQDGFAVTVVLASEGYQENMRKAKRYHLEQSLRVSSILRVICKADRRARCGGFSRWNKTINR